MSKYLIINADDFVCSYGINLGIIEARTAGVVTSTSVMVDSIAAHEAKELTKFSGLSIGLHFEVKEMVNIAAELERQIEKFVTIVGQMPSHIDTHKRRTTDKGILEVVSNYTEANNVPVRNFHAKHIGSFGVNSKDSSISQLKRSVDEATDEYNELMTHVGYSDDYLREHSSYSYPREDELKSLCSTEVRRHIEDKGLELITWSNL